MKEMYEPPAPARITRRRFLILAGGGLAGVVLASCGGAEPSEPAGGEAAPGTGGETGGEPDVAPVVIDFLAWGDPADVEAWDKLSQAYMAQNPNVTVNVTSVADPNANFYPKLNTAIAGGAAPHVASFQGWEWQTFADKGVLAAIDDFVSGDSYFDRVYQDDIASILVSTKRKDRRYLIPMQLGTMVMFYSKPIFDEMGVAYPTDDWTLEQFLEMAQQLTDTSRDSKRFGFQTNGSWFRDIQWIRSTGKQEFDELVDPRTSQFNQPEIVEALQLFGADVIHEMKIAPSAADTEGGSNVIETGNVGLKYEGPWFFGRLNSPELRDQGKEIPFDVVLMPRGADDSRPHRGWAEGIALPQTDDVAAAWGFARYMASEEGDRVYAETTGRIPNNLDLVESFWIPTIKERFGVENGQAFVEAFRRSEVDVISGVPRSKMWSEVVKPSAYDVLANNSGTAADVLPRVDQELQALLDDHWASQ